MKLNLDLIRRSFRSFQIRLSAIVGLISAGYLALPPGAQLEVYMTLQPYMPSAGWVGVIVSIVGIVLRAKTTKALSER